MKKLFFKLLDKLKPKKRPSNTVSAHTFIERCIGFRIIVGTNGNRVLRAGDYLQLTATNYEKHMSISGLLAVSTYCIEKQI